MARPKLTDVVCEPEHYSNNCGCTIPEAWVGIVRKGPKIMADSSAEVIAIAKSEGFAIDANVKREFDAK